MSNSIWKSMVKILTEFWEVREGDERERERERERENAWINLENLRVFENCIAHKTECAHWE